MQPFSEREGGSNTFGYSNSISVCFYKCAISSSDPKGSPFENKTIERTLSVELSGTAGKPYISFGPFWMDECVCEMYIKQDYSLYAINEIN